jgi:hypothetical protein
MPISASAATSIRNYFTKIQAYLKVCPLSEISPARNLAAALYELAAALYEFNRAGNISAIRPAALAPEAQLREDALENVRLLLASDLEKAIDQEAEGEALNAARELCRVLISATPSAAAVN